MKFFVSCRQRDAALAEIADLKQRVVDAEARYDETEGKRRRLAGWLATEKAANKRLGEELAAVSIVNTCLTEDLATLREQLAEARALLSDGAIAEALVWARREKKRADRLQKELDDATFLPVGGVEDSRRWQPGYVDPKADAS